MNNNLFHGIEFQKNVIKFLTLKIDNESGKISIFSKAVYPNIGFKNGYISDFDLFIKNFKQQLNKYESQFKLKIESVFMVENSLTNKLLTANFNQNTINQSFITEEDLIQLENKALKFVSKKDEYELISFKAVNFKINNFDYSSKESLVGLDAKKIEAKYSFNLILKNHFKLFEKAFDKLDLEIESFIFGPLKNSEVILSNKEKEIGVLVVNIQDDITTLIGWEESYIKLIEQINYGNNDILKEFSLKNKIPLDIAQKEFRKINDNEKIKYFEILMDKIKSNLLKFNKEYNIVFSSGIVVYSDLNLKNEIIDNFIKEKLFLPLNNDILKNKRVFDAYFDYTNIYSAIIDGYLKEKNNSFDFKKILRKIFKK